LDLNASNQLIRSVAASIVPFFAFIGACFAAEQGRSVPWSQTPFVLAGELLEMTPVTALEYPLNPPFGRGIVIILSGTVPDKSVIISYFEPGQGRRYEDRFSLKEYVADVQKQVFDNGDFVEWNQKGTVVAGLGKFLFQRYQVHGGSAFYSDGVHRRLFAGNVHCAAFQVSFDESQKAVIGTTCGGAIVTDDGSKNLSKASAQRGFTNRE
jgi:hypothetical protein